MKNLKLEVKNFKGTLSLPYQIKHEIKENYVVLSLYISFNDTLLCADCVSAIYENDAKEGVSEALKKASEKWGIQLTKANLNVA